MLQLLSTYAALYAGLNLYLYSLLRRAGWRSARVSIAFWCVAALMIAAPVAARALDAANERVAAQAVSLAGSAWMLAVFWALCAGLAADLWNVSLCATGFAFPASRRWRAAYRPVLLATAGIGLGLAAWGLHEAADVRLKVVRLQSSRLAKGTGPVKILQISDLHLGLHVREASLSRVLNIVHRTNPDVLVSTGDLLDSAAPHVRSVVAQFALVEPPGGKFAVIGNHELYAGPAESLRLLDAAGFVVLRGQRAAVKVRGAVVLLAGVDFPRHAGLPGATHSDEHPVLPGTAHDYFTVLLKHEPRVTSTSVGRFDLQLSGHTHGGQIVPFGRFVRFFYPYLKGAHVVSRDSLLYVSPGIGTWGPPLRVLARPEVTLFIVEPAG